ncbi:MAG: acyl carrier protein [Flavobacteriales bacterium]|nr:acyl carrier protein [Flavobacteriales bacterium]
MITVAEFIEKLEQEFDDVTPGTLHPNFNYREIENWGSMHALIIIAFIDTEFDISLSGADLRNTTTIQELFDLVASRK